MKYSTIESSLIGRALACLLVWALLLSSTVVLAAPKNSHKRQAAKIAREGVRLYENGDFLLAGDRFISAYNLSKRPVQLRNAAKAFQQGGMRTRALSLWQRYRDLRSTSAEGRAEAEANIDLILEQFKNESATREATTEARETKAAIVAAPAQIAPMQVGPVQVAPFQEGSIQNAQPSIDEVVIRSTPREAEIGAPIVAYASLGGAATLVAASGILWLLASSQLSSLDEKLGQRDGNNLIVGSTPETTQDELSSINAKRTASGVLLGAGLAAGAFGLVWLFLDDEQSEEQAENLHGWSWGTTDSGFSIAWSGPF